MITVCIATYNGEDVIRRQLDSILPQLGEDDEVIVSDDQSTDRTVEIVKSYQSPLIKIIKGPSLGTPIANFQNALRHAKGDYIFLSDQDDQWMPRKVSVMTEALKDHCCVVSDCHVTDGELKMLNPSFYALNHTRPGWMYNLFRKNGYLGCCMAFRRCVLEKALPFPKHAAMHDIWIGNVAAMYYGVHFIQEPLINFCRHDHNVSNTAGKSTATIRQKFLFRWHTVTGLLARKLKIRKP